MNTGQRTFDDPGVAKIRDLQVKYVVISRLIPAECSCEVVRHPPVTICYAAAAHHPQPTTAGARSPRAPSMMPWTR